MPLVSLRQLLDHAAENGYGVGAFNVNNMEQVQAVMQAAQAVEAPVILQATPEARAYTQGLFLKSLIQAAALLFPEIPTAFHFDHGRNQGSCLSALDLGFTSVMMDGSLLEDGSTPAEFDYNVEVTRNVVVALGEQGIPVEGELSGPPGTPLRADETPSDDTKAIAKPIPTRPLTDPETAEQFVRETGVAALAVAVGTSHGAYRFGPEVRSDVLDLDRIAAIQRRVPNTHLTLHGSSSTPLDLQDVVNEYGGDILRTNGVPLAEIQRAIQAGIRKINVETDNRIAFIGVVRKTLFENPQLINPRDLLGPARQAMKEVSIERMVAFGQAGRAPEVRERI